MFLASSILSSGSLQIAASGSPIPFRDAVKGYSLSFAPDSPSTTNETTSQQDPNRCGPKPTAANGPEITCGPWRNLYLNYKNGFYPVTSDSDMSEAFADIAPFDDDALSRRGLFDGVANRLAQIAVKVYVKVSPVVAVVANEAANKFAAYAQKNPNVAGVVSFIVCDEGVSSGQER